MTEEILFLVDDDGLAEFTLLPILMQMYQSLVKWIKRRLLMQTLPKVDFYDTLCQSRLGWWFLIAPVLPNWSSTFIVEWSNFTNSDHKIVITDKQMARATFTRGGIKKLMIISQGVKMWLKRASLLFRFGKNSSAFLKFNLAVTTGKNRQMTMMMMSWGVNKFTYPMKVIQI